MTLTDLASIFEFALDLHVINTSTVSMELKMRTTEMDVCLILPVQHVGPFVRHTQPLEQTQLKLVHFRRR